MDEHAVSAGKRLTFEAGGDTVLRGAWLAASANVGQQKMKSEFASVTEQSGIKAGDGDTVWCVRAEYK